MQNIYNTGIFVLSSLIRNILSKLGLVFESIHWIYPLPSVCFHRSDALKSSRYASSITTTQHGPRESFFASSSPIYTNRTVCPVLAQSAHVSITSPAREHSCDSEVLTDTQCMRFESVMVDVSRRSKARIRVSFTLLKHLDKSSSHLIKLTMRPLHRLRPKRLLSHKQLDH